MTGNMEIKRVAAVAFNLSPFNAISQSLRRHDNFCGNALLVCAKKNNDACVVL